MNQPVLFSIVVPTYNRAHLISKTIESILNQTYTNFELLIIDDGSTDDTEIVLRKYLSQKVFYYKKTNEERAVARNYGTQRAKGDYVNWFDSDDIMSSDNLLEAANTIERYGMIEVFVQGFKYLNESGNVFYESDFSSDVNQDLYIANLVANSPVIVRRDIALANPFNQDRELSGSEDYELWLRLAPKYRFYTSEKKTISYICHSERSTVLMRDPQQLINRYSKFLYYTMSNAELVSYLGAKKKLFLMKNYLILAVDLIVNNHRLLGVKYLLKGATYTPKILIEKRFYAFVKHFFRSLLFKSH